MADFKTKFSGIKKEYETGATRDSAENKGRFDLIPAGPLRRLAGVYERGAQNHGERNWEKGFNFSRAIDSALRHINQYREGLRDEDHLNQAVWNLFAIIHFEEMIERGLLPKELNDIPSYIKQDNPETYECEWNDKDIFDNMCEPKVEIQGTEYKPCRCSVCIGNISDFGDDLDDLDDLNEIKMCNSCGGAGFYCDDAIPPRTILCKCKKEK